MRCSVNFIQENLCRHPSLSRERRDRLVREGRDAAGFGLTKDQAEDSLVEVEQVCAATEEIVLAAWHRDLTGEDLGVLCGRWMRQHEAYRIIEERLMAEDPTGSQHFLMAKNNPGSLLCQAAIAIGRCAALLVTHPQVCRAVQNEIFSELNRGEASRSVWEYALKHVFSVEYQGASRDNRLFEARYTGFKGEAIVFTWQEEEAWREALGVMKCRPRDSSDAIVVRAAIEGSTETASIVMNSPELRERIEWTPDLIRLCLLSSVKEVRRYGLEGVAALKGRETLVHDVSSSPPVALGQEPAESHFTRGVVKESSRPSEQKIKQ